MPPAPLNVALVYAYIRSTCISSDHTARFIDSLYKVVALGNSGILCHLNLFSRYLKINFLVHRKHCVL